MPIVLFVQKIDGIVFALATLSVLALRIAWADDRSTLQLKLFLAILAMTIIELGLDLVTSILDGNARATIALNAAYTTYFIIQPAVTYLYSLYSDYHAFFDAKRVRRLAYILSPPIVIHAAMSALSPITGWIFRIDGDGVYSRGEFFLGSTAVPFAYIAFTFVSTLLHWRRLSTHGRFSMLLFALPPMVGGIFQGTFPMMKLLWPGVSLSLLMTYLTIESEILSTDHLTGLQNRRSFERNLSRRLKSPQGDKLFSLIMLDLDGFKLINDTFGHAAGDEALVEAAGVLRRCLHADDYIARYAGDEFVVLANLQRYDDAATVVGRIAAAFDAFNSNSSKPWKLSASIGSAIREPGEQPSPVELLAMADFRMYEAKVAARAVV